MMRKFIKVNSLQEILVIEWSDVVKAVFLIIILQLISEIELYTIQKYTLRNLEDRKESYL